MRGDKTFFVGCHRPILVPGTSVMVAHQRICNVFPVLNENQRELRPGCRHSKRAPEAPPFGALGGGTPFARSRQ